MTKAVVDHFEAIEVQEQHRELTSPALLQRDEAVSKYLHEHQPVTETRQRIPRPAVAQRPLRFESLGDVGNRSAKTDRTATDGVHHDAAAEHVPIGPVFMPESMLVDEFAAVAGHIGIDGLPEHIAILRVHAVEPLVRRTGGAGGRQADDVPPLRREANHLALKIPLPQAVADARLQKRETCFTSLKSAVGSRAVGDVVPDEHHTSTVRNDLDLQHRTPGGGRQH